jgi:translation initiation factor IF-3
MDLRQALQLAQELGLDLAEISPNSNPPVCKILDYGKYKYELKKKAQKAKKNQVVTQLKEIQFRPNTDDHDIEYKVKHIKEFLEDGDKVKVSIRFRGREASHAQIGHALLKQIIDMVGSLGIVEQSTKMEGKILHLVFGPNKTQQPKKASTKPEAATAPAAPKPPASPAAKSAPASGSMKPE